VLSCSPTAEDWSSMATPRGFIAGQRPKHQLSKMPRCILPAVIRITMLFCFDRVRDSRWHHALPSSVAVALDSWP
jgi:hypothetical protein